MVPGQKNIILRYTLIVFIMALLAIAIIAKAAIIMFAERQYWKDVADRFIKENVIVHPTRGNIISSDGKLIACQNIKSIWTSKLEVKRKTPC